MPWSETALRPWIIGQLAYFSDLKKTGTVTDTGAGGGAAREGYGPHLPGARWTGIEIHGPYADMFALRDIYDDLIIADARTLDPFPAADLCLMCDVAEHMEPGEAVALWGKARAVSKWLVLSMPLVPYPQGECYGNPYEAHLHDWTAGEVLEAFPGIVSVAMPPEGMFAGAFIAKGLA